MKLDLFFLSGNNMEYPLQIKGTQTQTTQECFTIEIPLKWLKRNFEENETHNKNLQYIFNGEEFIGDYLLFNNLQATNLEKEELLYE